MARTPVPVDAGIAIGQTFLGKYRVESILGQGGMGVVAKCVHLGLDKYVAIKMLRQDVLLDRDATERFTREARAASQLHSEHVARVEDVGAFESGVPYMVMEFLEGHDLGQLVEERGALQAPFATMLMLQAAEALAEAHSAAIVHRDVKPSNLFVTWRPDGSAIVKVLDFGISKSPMGTDMKLTQTQSLLGTPAYMSPEQMRSARLVDARTDIWSLGTVFYELLEGRRPFEAESFSEMCVKVAVDPPTPMVNTPPALQSVIMRCLAKNPDQRYASMADFGRDLLPHVQDVHQASLLVDRMQRVLGRRSNAAGDQWENSSTGVGRAPIAVRDYASAPIPAPWHPGSEPFGTPLPTPSPFQGQRNTPDPRIPRIPTETERQDSAPAVSQLVAAQRGPKRSRLPLFMLAFAAVGVAIAVAVIVGSGNGDDDQLHVKAPPANPNTQEQTPPAPDPKPAPPVKDETPAAGTGSDSKAQPEQVGSDDQTKIEIDPVKPPVPPKVPVRPPRNNGGVKIVKPQQPPKVKDEPKTVKVETPVAPPPDKNKSPNGKCTLFDKLPNGEWPAACK